MDSTRDDDMQMQGGGEEGVSMVNIKPLQSLGPGGPMVDASGAPITDGVHAVKAQDGAGALAPAGSASDVGITFNTAGGAGAGDAAAPVVVPASNWVQEGNMLKDTVTGATLPLSS